MQADQIGMADVGGRAELTLEAVQLCPIHLRQHLEGRPVAAVYVHRLEDDPHPPAAELANQAIVAQPRRSRWRVIYGFGGLVRI